MTEVNFDFPLILGAGDSVIVVTATDNDANIGTDTITVTNSGDPDPLELDPVMWLRAEDVNEADGGNVRVWQDVRGGAPRVGTLTGTPTLQTGELNGLPVVRFAGAEGLNGIEFPWDEYTIVLVARTTGGSYPQSIMAAWDSGGEPSVFQLRFAGSDGVLGLTVNSGGSSQNLVMGAIGGEYNIATLIRGAANTQLRINGLPRTISAGLPIEETQRPTVGYRETSTGPVDRLTGDVAEILVFDESLSDANAAIVEAYLAARYALNQPAILVRDTFTDTNATSITSHAPEVDVEAGGWSQSGTGTFSIQSNRLANSGATGIALIDAGVADVRVEATETGGSGSAHNYLVAIRSVDVNNRWLLYHRPGATNDILLLEVTGGTVSTRDSASGHSTAGKRLTFEAIGNDLRGFIDGVEVVSYTSSVRNTVTTHGVAASNFSGSATFDDFAIIDMS